MDLSTFKPLQPGLAIGAQPGFAAAFNEVVGILNNLAPDPAHPGIVITRGPARWTLGLRQPAPGITLLNQPVLTLAAIAQHPAYGYWCLKTQADRIDVKGGIITDWREGTPTYQRILYTP